MLFRHLFLTLISVFLLAAATPHAAHADFAKASKSDKKPFCPNGTFFDLRNGGECWSCPSGTHRTIFPVTNKNACTNPSSSSWSKAVFRGKAKTPKPKDAFHDPRNGGEWWKCPSNRPRRTLYPVTDPRACATKNIFGEKLAHAQFLGKVDNPKPHDAFYDMREGGEYWSCPNGYKRTIFPVTAGNACEQVHPATYFSARYVDKFGCPKGTFFDLRGGGECWSCPASHPFRTINPVTANGACASTFGQIFAVDGTVICKQAVAAIRDGSAEIEKFQNSIDKITAPVLQPITGMLTKIIPDIRSPKALRDVLGKLRLDDPRFQQIVAELERVANQDPEKLAGVTMNPNVVCSGDAGKIRNALLDAGLRRDFEIKRAGLFDGFPIGSAHATTTAAETKHVLYMISASAALVKNNGPIGGGGSLAIVILTDLRDLVRVYVSIGPMISLTKNAAKGVRTELHREFGVMIFPSAAFDSGSHDNFAQVGELGMELGFGIPMFNDLFSRFREPLERLECIKDTADKLALKRRKTCKWDVDVGVNISFDPAVFNHPRDNIPGFRAELQPAPGPRRHCQREPARRDVFGRFLVPARRRSARAELTGGPRPYDSL